MQVNWFTVIAQILNFLVLVWLLKRFLYKPILKAIDKRENLIAAQIKDAEVKNTHAKNEQAKFIKKNEIFDKEKKELMAKAIAETDEERQLLLETVRNEVRELRAKLESSLKETQENMKHDLAQKTQEQVFSIARKTLSDLASINLEEQIVNNFIKRLKELTKEENQRFLEAFKTSSIGILVQSSNDLSDKIQTDLKYVVNELLDDETLFRFKTAPKIISGVELISNGYKLAWSISEYLNSLQKGIPIAIIKDLEAKTEEK